MRRPDHLDPDHREIAGAFGAGVVSKRRHGGKPKEGFTVPLQYVWGQYAMHNLGANSARPLVDKLLILWLEGIL